MRMRSRASSVLATTAAILAAPTAAFAQAPADPPRPLKVTAFAADDGVDAVGPMAPAWCEAVPAAVKAPSDRVGSRNMLERQFMGIERSGWGNGALEKIAGLLCVAPDDASYQAQTGHVVQAWINVTGLSAADAVASISRRVDTATWNRQREETCAALAVNPELTGARSELARVQARVFGCGGGGLGPYWRDDSNPPDRSLTWFLDEAAAPPSQTIASYAVLRCLSRPGSGTLSNGALGRYASCGVEARALDAARLESELAASGWNDHAKTIAREQHGVARRRVARFEREVRALAAKDPAYQQIFYDAPAAAWTEWTRFAADHRQALDDAFAFEARFVDNPARASGCAAPLHAPLAAWIESRRATSVAEADTALTTGLGYVLGTRLAACLAAEGKVHIALPLMRAYEKARPARGPRLAAHYAAAEAIAAVRAERPRFPLSPSDLRIEVDRDLRIETSNLIGGKLAYRVETEEGVVKSAKRDGDWVAIVFKTERWKQTAWSCKDTRSVSRIDVMGNVHYHQDCVAAGTRTMSKTPRAIRVPAAYAAGIKPGSFVVFWADSFGSETDRRGAVREVWDSKARGRLVAYLGLAL